MQSHHGFTLVELLVVIAILSILAALLFPVLSQARARAKQTQCLTQIRQIGLGTTLYVNDFDDAYMPVVPFEAAINGGGNDDWPYEIGIMPYVRNGSVFQCPNDTRPWDDLSIQDFWDGSYQPLRYRRSYAVIGNIFTVQEGLGGVDPNTGIGVGFHTIQAYGRVSSDFSDPSDTLELTEDYLNDPVHVYAWVGEPSGSAFINCDAYKVPGRKYPSTGPADELPCPPSYDWALQPEPYHAGGEMFAFVDGHCKPENFYQVRQDDFFMYKADKPAQQYYP